MVNTRRSKKTLLGGCTTRGGKATGTPMEDPKTGQVEKSSANQKVNIVSVRVFGSVQAVTVIKYIKVCLESIFVNEEEIFVGKTHFVIDGDQQRCSQDVMVTESIKIQNGIIIDSLCIRRPEIETTSSSQ